MLSRMIFLLSLAATTVFAQAPNPFEELNKQYQAAEEACKKWEQEVRIKPPSIQFFVFDDDKEVSPDKYKAVVSCDQNILVPVEIYAGSYTFRRECENPCICIQYQSTNLVIPYTDCDPFKKGAIILVHFVHSKALLDIEKKIPTPLQANDQYKKICFFFDTRFNLRERWLSMPLPVRARIQTIISMAIEPRACGDASYCFAYIFM